MLRLQHRKTSHSGRISSHNRIGRLGVFLVVAVLVVSGCRRAPEAPSPDPTPAPTESAAPVTAVAPPATGTPAATPTPGPAAQPTRVATAQVSAKPEEKLIAVPILADELAPGWDLAYSWTTQFEPSQEEGPGGATAYKTVFHGDSSGLVFSMKQDSLVRHLLTNYTGVRVWINPGDRQLPSESIKLGVLSSKRLHYLDLTEQPVPKAESAGEEAALADFTGAVPAGKWTEVTIPFDKLPSPPTGRYLTGLYIRADNIAGQSLLLSGLELLAVPDEKELGVLAVAGIDLTSLRVEFSKDVHPASAENPANYRISSASDPAFSSPQTPASAKYEPDTTSAVLTLSQALQAGDEYSVEVQGVTDLAPKPNVLAAPAMLTFTATAMQVKVDLTRPAHPISPLIYGIAGNKPEYMKLLRPGLTNWGGNPTSRYNWELGNAFNAGSDWEYRNTDYGYAGSATDQFILDAQSVSAEVRMTLPTLGWVAKDTDNNTCSFRGRDGKCYNPYATCEKPGQVADPSKANLQVDVDWVIRWVKHMIEEKGLKVRFFALDNEPELWGYTHYDVHPKCTTYEEILGKYLTYATAVRAVAPDAELLGPVTCCWYFYWNSAAGAKDKAKHDNRDFLPWFLEQVRLNDEKTGVRTLDALDIHYYPENVYNDKDDPETSAARVQATRSLWDGSYVDPSWIAEAVNLIPRMKQLIAENYPGTRLFISEWNFGGDKSMSGALAIADTLGIFGQEDLYAASYYQSPELNSPGFFGFKLYTNYDDKGGRFGDTALPATSPNRDQLAAYAAKDSKSGKVTLMLINKLPDQSLPFTLQLEGLTGGQAELYRYGQDQPEGIVRETVELTANSSLTLPPYSITLLVIPQQGK